MDRLRAFCYCKDSTGAVISADNYTVSYSDANSTKLELTKVTVKFNGKKYAGTKELSYTISAKPAATTTVTNAATESSCEDNCEIKQS